MKRTALRAGADAERARESSRAFLARRLLFLGAAVVMASGLACSPPPDATSRYSVLITAFDPEWKIRSIKAIREETGLGLADAKRLVDEAPSVVREGLTQSEAEALAARLRAQRLTVQLNAPVGGAGSRHQ